MKTMYLTQLFENFQTFFILSINLMEEAVLGNGSFAAHFNFLKLFFSRFDHILFNYNASNFCKTFCGAFAKHTVK
jgi:hypothetical protein